MPLIMVIAVIINQALRIYQLLLLVYALMSWFPSARGGGLWNFVTRLVHPYLEIFDRYIPSIGGVSFNVMIGIFVLQLAQRGIMTLLTLLT